MSKARNLADLLDASGDVSTAALDNVPPSNDASALTTGTLPVDRIPYVGRRNLIINGGFDVWQRGTSFSGLGNAGYTADRWTSGTSQTGTVSRESFTVGQEDVTGSPEYYLRWDKSGTGDWSALSQKIENVRPFDGQTVTVSFWAKADANVTSKIWLSSNFGSGGSTAVTTTLEPFTTTTSWQKFTFTFELASFTGKTIGSGSFLQLALSPDGTVASWTGTWEVANVQLELGSVATPFEHRSYGEELALCQRYFEKAWFLRSGYGGSTVTGNQNTILFSVTKRAAPTVTLSTYSSMLGIATNTPTTYNLMTTGFSNSPGAGTGFYRYSTEYSADAEL